MQPSATSEVLIVPLAPALAAGGGEGEEGGGGPNCCWQPNLVALNDILEVLRNTQNPDTTVQQNIHRALLNFKINPEFNRYLIFLLIHRPDQPDHLRICAGLLLKNNIHDHPSLITRDDLTFLQSTVIQGLSDRLPDIRKTAALIITTILQVGSFHSWPGILTVLLQSLDHPSDLHTIHGAFIALQRISEDHAEELDSTEQSTTTKLLPKLLTFFKSNYPELRKMAIGCVINFIKYYPKVMENNKEEFIMGYFYLCNDVDPSVRIRAISALLLMAEKRMKDLRPYLHIAVQAVLAAMQHEDEDVAFEATGFWPIMLSNTGLSEEFVLPMLPQILPVLLNRMVYAEKDLIDLGADKDQNSHVPDKPQDIKPQFTTTMKGATSQKDDIDDEDAASDWNIRKASAEALDHMGQLFKNKLLQYLLPFIQIGFQSTNWLIKESTILALGCISGGCLQSMTAYLPNLVEILFSFLNDPKPLIRSISCWVLARYSSWIADQENIEKYRTRLIRELLGRVYDPHKIVQKAAVNGISLVALETDKSSIAPYTEQILVCFKDAYQFFQRQNLASLHRTIGTLAEVLEEDLNIEAFRIILPSLLSKWETLSDSDTSLSSLLECLSFVAVAMGPAFTPFTKPLFDRSIRIMTHLINSSAHREEDDATNAFLTCSIDLLSGLCVALKNTIEPLISSSNLVYLLIEICRRRIIDSNEGCFALFGDLAKYAPSALVTSINQVIPLLIKGINIDHEEEANNAIWALGEVMMKTPTAIISPYTEEIFKMVNYALQQGIEMETCAVTLGRLALHNPVLVGAHLKNNGKQLCVAMRSLVEDEEKEDAVRGLCNAVSCNPVGIIPNFQTFCDVIASVYHPTPPLMVLFKNLLHAFKNQSNPNEWQKVINTFPDRLKRVLVEKYEIFGDVDS